MNDRAVTLINLNIESKKEKQKIMRKDEIMKNIKVRVTQSDSLQPHDWIPQARILEWVAVPFSWGISQTRDQTQFSHIAGRFFSSWATRKVLVAKLLVLTSSAGQTHECWPWKFEFPCFLVTNHVGSDHDHPLPLYLNASKYEWKQVAWSSTPIQIW